MSFRYFLRSSTKQYLSFTINSSSIAVSSFTKLPRAAKFKGFEPVSWSRIKQHIILFQTREQRLLPSPCSVTHINKVIGNHTHTDTHTHTHIYIYINKQFMVEGEPQSRKCDCFPLFTFMCEVAFKTIPDILRPNVCSY